MFDLVCVRAAYVRIPALLGQGNEVADSLEWLVSAARGTEDPQTVVMGLGSAALVRGELAKDEAAAALLAELESFPGVRDSFNYPALLPAMVRAAVRIDERALAARLVTGLEPRYPLAEHALAAANAALAEAGGNLQFASDAYADAADRWERFGIVPERAFALLGRGRCLIGLSRPIDAAPDLQQACAIFERLQAVSALAPTEALLAQATALSP
ncbi:MAG: hypothetical protein OEV60_06260 [Actinomycetota bacterium]|nr:hypothetical protein [Actinomycetota bacterium]MDH5223341.1 hypothetical protein [Actinomycetota bacterium]MDH5312417.1 hypothetical protein [Actinomycetota bacterium]